MSKTVKTVLKVLGYIIAALLGAAGEATMMSEGRCKTYELWNVKMVSISLSMPVRCGSL